MYPTRSLFTILSKTQCKWSTVEKEAYAIHFALQKLDHYLHGAQFVIKTDHKPLKYLLESPIYAEQGDTFMCIEHGWFQLYD